LFPNLRNVPEDKPEKCVFDSRIRSNLKNGDFYPTTPITSFRPFRVMAVSATAVHEQYFSVRRLILGFYLQYLKKTLEMVSFSPQTRVTSTNTVIARRSFKQS